MKEKERVDILGVVRAQICSPNNVESDKAIMQAVADKLQEKGFQVSLLPEEDLMELDTFYPVVVNMCRLDSSIKRLQSLENRGGLVINSAKAIFNCTREEMTGIFSNKSIPQPESLILDINEDIQQILKIRQFNKCWLKRGDCQSRHPEDVVYCEKSAEVEKKIDDYRKRGIERVVVNRHIEGDLVKFYGVQGSDFFYWFYPGDVGYDKFGTGESSPLPRHFEFNSEELKTTAKKAAAALGVMIYGGDCIVNEKGEISIIDLNDWPSFSPCRKIAAESIAECIATEIRRWQERK